MIDKKFTYALVGATNRTNKFGYKILADLNNAGFKVIPINPHEKEILGIRSYPSLATAPIKPDVVILVVPSSVGIKILTEMKELSITKAWFQPGAESDECLEFCLNNNIEVVHNACIMVDRHISH